MKVALAFYYWYTEPRVIQPGAGELDPRLWWARYRAEFPPQPVEREPDPVPALVDLQGVAAVMQVGAVEAVTVVVIRSVRVRGRAGWLRQEPDPWAALREADEHALEAGVL